MGMSVIERMACPADQQQAQIENALANARCCMPGIIYQFNPATQTATVQPAVKESVKQNNAPSAPAMLPLLPDVPVQFPRGGGYAMTFPVQKGDECILVFSDLCIDGWWQSGGVQAQAEGRRHDLSDAMAILGVCSAPRALQNVSGDSLQIRSESGAAYLEIKGDKITLKAGSVDVNGTVF